MATLLLVCRLSPKYESRHETIVALFFLALVDSGSRLAVLKAVLG